jgi:aromatic-amino-acid transaminase
MDFYTSLARISKDPIVGLLQLASKDQDPSKLVAIIGSAADDKGDILVPGIVSELGQKVMENSSVAMSYAPSTGLPGLANYMLEEILGRPTLDKLNSVSILNEALVTAGGTNAISTVLIACSGPNDEIITHHPHWAGYDSITQAIVRKNLRNFSIIDDNQNFNFSDFEKTINEISQKPQNKLIIILNLPFDNPLGKSFSEGTWKEIANILTKYSNKDILIILDTAYIDFGPGGKDYSRLAFLPELMNKVPNLSFAIAGTLSKSFAMYGARIGVAALLSSKPETIKDWQDIVGGVIRGTLSNVSRPAQELALRIFQDRDKLASVHEFQRSTVQLIDKRKSTFIDSLQSLIPGELEIIEPDGGFFCSIKVSTKGDFAQKLYKALLADHVYLPLISDEFIRVPICGLSEVKLEKLAQRISAISKSILVAK